MEKSNALALKKKADELKAILEEIKNLYEPYDDEFINEMFYNGIHNAKKFCETLNYIIQGEK